MLHLTTFLYRFSWNIFMKAVNFLEERKEDITPVKKDEESFDFIASIPHAGVYVPKDLQEKYRLGRLALEDTDLFTDDLYDLDKGIEIVAELNRYVLNVNRPRLAGKAVQEYDDEDSLKNFLGDMNLSLQQPLDEKEKHNLLNHYDTYHRLIREKLLELKDKKGHAILFDCHSMNSQGAPNTPDEGRRPEIAISSAGYETASEPIVSLLQTAFREQGYDVVEDKPYYGGYTAERYGEPDQNIHALQIEIRKDVYMDEEGLKPTNVGNVNEDIQSALSRTSDAFEARMSKDKIY